MMEESFEEWLNHYAQSRSARKKTEPELPDVFAAEDDEDWEKDWPDFWPDDEDIYTDPLPQTARREKDFQQRVLLMQLLLEGLGTYDECFCVERLLQLGLTHEEIRQLKNQLF